MHIPDPVDLARERLGDRAEALLAEGRAMPFEDALEMARRIATPDVETSPA